MDHRHHPRPTVGDILYETVFAAAFGGAVIAFYFLITDWIGGQLLHTPSLAGQMLFFGVEPSEATTPDLMALSVMTAVHMVLFFGVGFLATLLVRQLEEWSGGGFVVPAIGLFVLLEIPAFVVAGVARPGLGAEVGHGSILIANALAAVVMVAFLRRAHDSAKRQTQVDEVEERSGATG